MSHRTVVGLAVLTLSAAGLMGCQKKAEAPAAPAAAPAPAAQTQVDIEAASQAAYEADANPKPSDPVDAFVWRVDMCTHLSGEIGGDRSEHDVQVQKTMEELKCGDEIIADGQALKAAHASDPAAVAKIDAALKAWTE
jgi:hypothetical protein